MARPFLGTADITVSELGFGAASIGNLYRRVTTELAHQTVDCAWQHGIRHFDTAPYYGFGLSERRLGDVLRERDGYVLSTKVGRLLEPRAAAEDKYGFCSPMPFEPVYDYSYDAVMRSFEDSQQRLGLSKIDIIYMHDIGRLTHGDKNEALFKIAMDGGYKAMHELREQGLVKAIGLGVNEYEVCEEALQYGDFDCFLLAGRYTLLEQGALQTFLPICEARKISIIIGGPFNSGVLAAGTKSSKRPTYNYAPASDEIMSRVASIERCCDRFDVPLAAAALQFPLAHPTVVSVIPGMGTAAHVENIVALMNTEIPDALWSSLRDVNLLDDTAPVPGQSPKK